MNKWVMNAFTLLYLAGFSKRDFIVGHSNGAYLAAKTFYKGQAKNVSFNRGGHFLGKNSYEVLTHMFVVYVLVNGYNFLNLSGKWAWGLYLSVMVGSGVLGELRARWYSNPANLTIRKYFKS